LLSKKKNCVEKNIFFLILKHRLHTLSHIITKFDFLTSVIYYSNSNYVNEAKDHNFGSFFFYVVVGLKGAPSFFLLPPFV